MAGDETERRGKTLAALVLIEADDPRLSEPWDMTDPASVAAMRQAVIDALPALTRVIAIMQREEAGLMMMRHEVRLRAAGIKVLRPTTDYVPPADRKH